MSEDQDSFKPPTSTAEPNSDTSATDFTAYAWQQYYKSLQPNASLVAQYGVQSPYPSYQIPQYMYPTQPGQQHLNATTNQHSAQSLHEVPPPPSAPCPVVQADDPLPPGKEEIEIPGLGGEAAASISMRSQKELYMEHISKKFSQGSDLYRTGDTSSQTIESQNELFARHMASIQNDAGVNSTTPIISAGFNFKQPVPQQPSAPFLIKPGIPPGNKPVTPAYLTVPPPLSLYPTVAQSEERKKQKADALRRIAEVKAAAMDLEKISAMEPPSERKRRKFDKGPLVPKPEAMDNFAEEIRKLERGARFSRSNAATSSLVSTINSSKQKDKLTGQCTSLEKSYFRLSGRPDPKVVRPESILEKALDRLINLYRKKEVNYFYANDQFKGMRQDCTVQQLQSEVSVRIYEASARAHLEYGEIWEYNQCQSNLESLYNHGVAGCRSEFLAYRILYQVLHIDKGEASFMNKTIRNTSPKDRAEPEVSHALQVAAALLSNDRRRVFQLYVTAPKLGRSLFEDFIEEMRYKTAKLFIKSIRLKEPIVHMVESMGFYCEHSVEEIDKSEILPGCNEAIHPGRAGIQSDLELACNNCAAWLRAHGAILVESEGGFATDILIDPIASRNKLFKPKAENAVAHGDPNLDMSYFLVNQPQT